VHPSLVLKLGKNKDNTLKSFLGANNKFNPGSGVDDLNILFVACEHHANLNGWHRYLYGDKGFLPGIRSILLRIGMLTRCAG